MGDQHRLAQPRFERRGGMADMDHEGAAADRGAVDPFRSDAEVVRDRDRRLAGGRDAINVLRPEPGILHRVQRGIGMQADLRQVRDAAQLGRLGGADDGDRFRFHRAAPLSPWPFAGRNNGRVISSSIFSKATSSSMSRTRASGVCGQSTMLVIIRGPSSSSTAAIAYGGVKPGTGRWWIT